MKIRYCFAGAIVWALPLVPGFAATSSSVAATEDGASPETSAAGEEAPRNRLIEEIVVTAQKREENLQDVPISVQAFSGDLLDAKGIDEPKGLQLSTPGLQYNVFAGYSQIYIRGTGTDAFVPSADASVATYIDGLYFPSAFSLASALGVVERIEILKGPQGTLFGRNSTGGAINIVTRQPGREAESSLVASLESYDRTAFRAYSSVLLTDSFAFSVAGLSYSEDSYYDLAASSPRTRLPRDNSRAFSVKAAWSPIDELRAVLGYTYANTTGGTAISLPVSDVKPLGRALGVQQEQDYRTGEDAPVFLDNDARVLSADLKFTGSAFDARAILGYQDIRSSAEADYDGSSQPLVTFSFANNGQFSKVKTAELQLLSNDDSWASDWLTWIGGLYYIDSTGGYDPVLFSLGPGVAQFLASPPTEGPLSGMGAVTGPLLGIFGSVPGLDNAAALLEGGITMSLSGVLDTKSSAGFFQFTADLGDSVSLTAGARYQTEKRGLTKSTVALVPNPNSPNEVLPIQDWGMPSVESSNFSPKVTLNYKFEDGGLAYLSYSQGYKSGTYNIIAIYTPPQYVEPEKITAFEFGFKRDLLDGTLRLNGAVFQNNIDNLQVQTLSLMSGGAVRFETAGAARIRGAEFDLTWQPLPEILPGLALTSGAAYLDGVYTDYRNGSGFDEETGLAFDGTIFPARDFTGNRVVRTPRLSGNLGLGYVHDLDSGSIEFATDAYYNSGSYFSAQNTESSRESSYSVLNARISYFYQPWDLRLTVFGKNLTDAKYHVAISDVDFGTAKLLAPPAVYGVKLNWNF